MTRWPHAVAIGFVVASSAFSGEPTGFRQWKRLYDSRAAAERVVEESDPPVELTLATGAMLNFANPVRGESMHGAAYVWTDRGAPRMIGTVWSAEDRDHRQQRNLCYEFYSLSSFPLAATLDHCDVEWKPRTSGLNWLPLSDAQQPAATRALRLVQMRRFAAEWDATGNPEESELRLLPQPVYRYPEDVPDSVDGAIFAFVMGTDPELCVVLEAHRGAADTETSWRIAPARLTGSQLTLKRNGEAVWSSPAWEEFARDKPYDFLYGVEHLTEDDLPAADP